MKTLKDAVQIDSNAMTMYELGLEDSTSTDNGIQASSKFAFTVYILNAE